MAPNPEPKHYRLLVAFLDLPLGHFNGKGSYSKTLLLVRPQVIFNISSRFTEKGSWDGAVAHFCNRSYSGGQAEI
jgi:hypothetical protein